MAESSLLGFFQKAVSKLGELYNADKPVYLFTVRVDSIEPQRDEVDHSIKRGKAKVVVEAASKKSMFQCTVEFRGRTLIVSRLDGDYGMDDLVKRLNIEYSKRYPKESLKSDRVLKEGKIRHFIVTNPKHFLDFLHFLHNVELEIYSQQGEHAVPKWIHWINARNLRRSLPASNET